MSTKKNTALFRCDASKQIGAGHLVRCIAIAEALTANGWFCDFVCEQQTIETFPAIQVADVGLTLLPHEEVDSPTKIRSLWPGGIDLLVVDNYGLDIEFEEKCRGWARRILVIDDLANRRHECDFLLDSSASVSDCRYKKLVAPTCRLLFGPRFAILRDEFEKARPDAKRRRSHVSTLSNIFLSFGANDRQKLAPISLKALAKAGFTKDAHVILGATSHSVAAVKSIVPSLPFSVELCINPSDVAKKMCDADLAIGAGGGTAWERCCLGLPTILIVTADNQLGIAGEITAAGAAEEIRAPREEIMDDIADVFVELSKNPKRLRDMSNRAFELCDGIGAKRVAQVLS